MARVFRADEYLKDKRKLDSSEIRRVEIIEKSLVKNPLTGRPLSYPFFRERKFDGKRVLFLWSAENEAVLLICIATKKTQREDIVRVLTGREEYMRLLQRFLVEGTASSNRPSAKSVKPASILLINSLSAFVGFLLTRAVFAMTDRASSCIYILLLTKTERNTETFLEFHANIV